MPPTTSPTNPSAPSPQGGRGESLTLPNGMRIIVDHIPSDVVYCGIAIDAGTRDEMPHESGMAHFTEHMSFKGTQRRRSWHIINRMETVGGELNAYTGKEETVYYCTTLRPHLRRAIDLLLDITTRSTYPQPELTREVEVVEDEIESYNDSPSELIFDEFEALLFPDHPLGRNILGNIDRLRQYTSDDVRRFAERQYTPDRMVLYVLGNVTLREVVRMVEPPPILPQGGGTTDNSQQSTPSQPPRGEEKGQRSRAGSPPPLGGVRGGLFIVDRDTHQSHVMIGARGYGAGHPRHLALYLLNNILGGPGMNSRLNMALRERNGLVYTVESNLTTYTDAGVWSIYFGCNPEDVKRCIRLVKTELRRLTAAPLKESTLKAAKRQIIGQIGVAYDNHETRAIGMAKRFLHYGTTQTPAQLAERIQALTPDDIWQTAREVFDPDHLTTLIYK